MTPPTKGTVAFSGTTAIYTPFTGQTGADAFTYRATGNAGATETRTATVIIANPPLPAITNVLSTTGTAGTPMSFNLTATNTPTLFSAGGGLPPGLFLNTTTGLIYGTPTTPGTYAAMVTATNAGGTSLSATVVFNIAAVLAVSKAGSGSGLVVSSLAGINCGATCTATYSAFSGVTLTATPAMGSVFAGWSDSNCMGANTCSLTMNVNKTITATFNAIVAPDAPTLNSVTPGPGNATLVFSAPVNNGGAAISGYTATCVASGEATRTSFGSGTPLTVGALTGGVLYSCSLTATNAAGFTSSASASLTVTPAPANRSNIAPLLMLLLD